MTSIKLKLLVHVKQNLVPSSLSCPMPVVRYGLNGIQRAVLDQPGDYSRVVTYLLGDYLKVVPNQLGNYLRVVGNYSRVVPNQLGASGTKLTWHYP